MHHLPSLSLYIYIERERERQFAKETMIFPLITYFFIESLLTIIFYSCGQVPPAELEALLVSHPSIADAAVVP
jgi:hypothetical protein